MIGLFNNLKITFQRYLLVTTQFIFIVSMFNCFIFVTTKRIGYELLPGKLICLDHVYICVCVYIICVCNMYIHTFFAQSWLRMQKTGCLRSCLHLHENNGTKIQNVTETQHLQLVPIGILRVRSSSVKVKEIRITVHFKFSSLNRFPNSSKFA